LPACQSRITAFEALANTDSRTSQAITPMSVEHPFAPFVRILGKGKSGSRSLSREEAREAFAMVLAGNVEEVQLGAFLMLLRVKEESPQELAGFVEACRQQMSPPPENLVADLDWSSYAGKKHQHPWYVLAMLLLADAGLRVFVHGSAGHTAGRLYTEQSFRQLGLPVAGNWADVAGQLDSSNLSYLPLQCFCPPLQELIQLRPLLGLRSPVNTLTRMLNPLAAPASLQSIFHPAYARLHQEADQLLGQPRALVFKGESGEVEVKPHAVTRLQLLTDGAALEHEAPRCFPGRADSVEQPATSPLRTLWRGEAENHYGLEATLATAATGLLATARATNWTGARQQAEQMWRERDTTRLAHAPA